jgi:dephospho-CoA kinase
MIKVGLTGGIGSGKSTVCRLFQELGVKIIDADIIARELVTPGQPALELLTEAFGKEILNENGELNRDTLRKLIFSDIIKKHLLEAIMHPLIFERITYEINSSQDHYCIVAIPLLLETNQAGMVDRVAIVDCSVETQVERVISRDRLSRDEILAIISSQISRESRLQLADDVIDNSTTTAQLAEQIKRLHNSYILLANARTSSA